MTRLQLRQWACTFNKTLGSDRVNTCYDTSLQVLRELELKGCTPKMVYAEQSNGFPHWFVSVNINGEDVIVDFTACQFSIETLPMVCIGTINELEARFKKQLFWISLEER